MGKTECPHLPRRPNAHSNTISYAILVSIYGEGAAPRYAADVLAVVKETGGVDEGLVVVTPQRQRFALDAWLTPDPSRHKTFARNHDCLFASHNYRLATPRTHIYTYWSRATQNPPAKRDTTWPTHIALGATARHRSQTA
jgi:hypothetical protein